jgi:hypothetical protein
MLLFSRGMRRYQIRVTGTLFRLDPWELRARRTPPRSSYRSKRANDWDPGDSTQCSRPSSHGPRARRSSHGAWRPETKAGRSLVRSGGIEARTGLRTMPTFPQSPYHSVRRVFPSTAGRLAFQAVPSRIVSGLSLLPACAVRRPVCIALRALRRRTVSGRRLDRAPPWRVINPRLHLAPKLTAELIASD